MVDHLLYQKTDRKTPTLLQSVAIESIKFKI